MFIFFAKKLAVREIFTKFASPKSAIERAKTLTIKVLT